MNLVDAHIHIDQSQQPQAIELAEAGLWQLVTATTPDDCARILDLAAASPRIIPSGGLHPWYADTFERAALDACLQCLPIIGEIGLDTVWTELPLPLQIEALVYQLQAAVSTAKPVILHTKGAEAEVLHWLRKYTPPRIIVHWYSGDLDSLAGYIEMGCYFTLGPDIHTNPIVQTVCRQAPLDRLLTETDGTEAVTWATGAPCTMADLPQVLLKTLAAAADLRGLKPEEMQQQVYANLKAFLSGIIDTGLLH